MAIGSWAFDRVMTNLTSGQHQSGDNADNDATNPNSADHPALMPPFQGEVVDGLDEGLEYSEDGEDDDKTKETKEKNKDTAMFAAAIRDDYATVQYPIVIDS